MQFGPGGVLRRPAFLLSSLARGLCSSGRSWTPLQHGSVSRVVVFANAKQAPFSNNLEGLLAALGRAVEMRVVEPMGFQGYQPTGGAAPAAVPHAAVEQAVDGFAPDAVVCLGGGHFVAGPDRSRHLGAAVMIGVALSDPQGFEASLAVARRSDLFYTQDPGCLPLYSARGVAARRLDLAVDPEVLVPLRAPRTHDVVFVGKWTPYRDRLLASLARRCRVAVHAHRGESRWSVPVLPTLETRSDLCQAYNRSRLALECARVDEDGGGFEGWVRITPRAFFAAACGVPTLIEPFPALDEYFKPGVEIATFSDVEELGARVEELLADGRRLRAIGKAARRRVVRCHTWEQRVAGLLADIQRLQPAPRRG